MRKSSACIEFYKAVLFAVRESLARNRKGQSLLSKLSDIRRRNPRVLLPLRHVGAPVNSSQYQPVTGKHPSFSIPALLVPSLRACTRSKNAMREGRREDDCAGTLVRLLTRPCEDDASRCCWSYLRAVVSEAKSLRIPAMVLSVQLGHRSPLCSVSASCASLTHRVSLLRKRDSVRRSIDRPVGTIFLRCRVGFNVS